VDCGTTRTTQEQCEGCWKEASSDVPWCYYAVDKCEEILKLMDICI